MLVAIVRMCEHMGRIADRDLTVWNLRLGKLRFVGWRRYEKEY